MGATVHARQAPIYLVTASALLTATLLGVSTHAHALPDSTVAEERAMVQVKTGEQFSLNVPNGKLKIRIASVALSDYRGWPNDSARLAVRITVKNFSTGSNGVGVVLRCGSSNDEGNWYADSTINPYRIPAQTQESGTLFIGMPKEVVDKGKSCVGPRLVIRPVSGYSLDSGVSAFAARLKLPSGLGERLR